MRGILSVLLLALAAVALLARGAAAARSGEAAAAAQDGAAAGAAAGRALQPVWQQNGPITEAQALHTTTAAVRRAPQRAVGTKLPPPPPAKAPQRRPRRLLAPPAPAPEADAGGRRRALQDGGDGGRARGRCVCTFDFDHTLRIERGGRQDVPAPDANGIIADCKSKGWGVALASANDRRDQITPVLEAVDSTTFNTDFYESPAFQIGEGNKALQLRRISESFGTPAACLVFFDDGGFNKQYADRTGAAWRQVDGDNGVTWRDYDRGRNALGSQCDCA